jgi:outer membrane protein TolC
MRVKLGDSNRTEKKYLEGRIASAEQNLINAQVGLGNAQSSLEFITGEKLNFDATLPDIKQDKKFANIENFLEKAFKNNTQISALNAEKESAEHSLEAVLGRYYPRLDFVVEAGHIQDRGGLTGNVRNGIAKLEMTIPIYDGGIRSALKRQRKAEIEEVAAKQLAFQRRLKQDLKTSYQNRVGAVEQIATAVREIETQLALEKLNKQQFRYGEKDIFITDLVESRERVFNAKLNKIKAETEYITSYYRIQQSLGEIFPEFCTKTCQVI